ncbi:F-box domain, cyclin-like protein [Artemisia annua]|uniref:F-box domain, cyclin-like protein n=1 Tax=Artemisia annua TaxID=35608 RepID=A0A2U1LVE8_ARTAN|nr:F-box domain, cyclin-like protein [Artemisia annua]
MPQCGIDYTNSLPDECLALIFNYITTTNDRNNSSLVSRRWLRIESQTRTSLTLHAPSYLPLSRIPSIFTRFNSLTQLVLRCDLYNTSINDHNLSLIASRCPYLMRLELRMCYNITDKGMAILSQKCKQLKIFSCIGGGFKAKGIITLLDGCSSLEELSVGYLDSGRLFEPLIIGSSSLKTLKMTRLSGRDWDTCLEMIAVSALSSLQVLHLEKLLYCTNTGLICVVEHCKYLKKLCIDNCEWGEIGNEALIAIAKYCLSLEELVLIGVDACRISLEAIVVNCRKLERLDLCESKAITDVEISYIAEKCVALKKLLIKECCVSDKGIEAFAMGCSTLVEIRVTKCRNVTHEVKDRLRARRGSLVIELDAVETEAVNAIICESGAQEHVAEVPPAAGHVAVAEPLNQSMYLLDLGS